MGSSFYDEINEMDVISAHIVALIFNKEISEEFNSDENNVDNLNGFYLVLTSWPDTLKINQTQLYVFKNILNFKLSSSFLSEEKLTVMSGFHLSFRIRFQSTNLRFLKALIWSDDAGWMRVIFSTSLFVYCQMNSHNENPLVTFDNIEHVNILYRNLSR